MNLNVTFFLTYLKHRKPCSGLVSHIRNLTTVKNDDEFINICGIQMLPWSIHKQIFKNFHRERLPEEVINKIKSHLLSHDLWGKCSPLLPHPNVDLPPLKGCSIAEHFHTIAEQQSSEYKQLLLKFISSGIPIAPENWNFSPGWTKYSRSGKCEIVDYPDEDAYVFDVEVCVKEGEYPTIATAVSALNWYSWCSPMLFKRKEKVSTMKGASHHYATKHLINLETKPCQNRVPKDARARIVIGHNVSYDRARVKEQYFVEGTKLRFLDTMSMHIAVSGVTSFQRSIMAASRKSNAKNLSDQPKLRRSEVLEWQNVSSFNGLNDVYKLYCGGLEIDKSKRDVFIHGSLSDVIDNYQQLTTYCAKDTEATFKVLQVLFPEFVSRFPHPVTLAGTLEMNTMYLPVNQNWLRYIQDSEDSFVDLESELTQSLKREADRACRLLAEEEYRGDPWLWNLDWSTHSLKIKKVLHRGSTKSTNIEKSSADRLKLSRSNYDNTTDLKDEESDIVFDLERKFSSLIQSRENLYKRNPHLPGYPVWYRSFCKRDLDGLLGPSDISTSSLLVPKLLKLAWEGYPLHHHKELGWGYLVPGRSVPVDEAAHVCGRFPVEKAKEFCTLLSLKQNSIEATRDHSITSEEVLNDLRNISALTTEQAELKAQWNAVGKSWENSTSKRINKETYTTDRPNWHNGIGPYDVGIAGCWFYRLPHKEGIGRNVGNPLAKDYLNKIEDGTLKTMSSSIAEHILKLNRNIIYWRNAKDRILSQIVVWLHPHELPHSISKSRDFDSAKLYGAILPQVVSSGTLTRRAVEPTWLTASNAYSDRLGSELKSMVQSPPGFCLVGADVDSQELWIASIIGDSHFAGQHGSTAFGWMTLQGRKSDGTDMHSRTASTVDITRDQAKILNYGRIYGAGEKFAKTLLMQFNHRMTEEEATEKARKIYSVTKGNCVLQLNCKGGLLAAHCGGQQNNTFSKEELISMRKRLWNNPSAKFLARSRWEDLIERRVWVGGTESYMFNKLEEIAQSSSPQTPVLNSKISRALEPQNVGSDFMTSRVNWVVQSSAVDYLHLLLVSMRHLLSEHRISGRLCISIHDEVRYLVREEDKFRAALALQVSNLWTRCMFAYQLGMPDLPLSVAFFSSVDIDSVLRKETNLDCQTPSNPYGLSLGYGIPFGKSYDVYEILEKTKGRLS